MARPRNTKDTPRPAGGQLQWTLGLVAAAVLIAWGLIAMQQRSGATKAADATTAAVAEVVAEMRRGLPQPFAPGLVTESIEIEGNRLIVRIRSERRRAERAHQDRASLMRVAEAEQAQLLQLCQDPGVARVLAHGVTLVRRFVDADGGLFFDVSITAAECAPTARTG
ncbi:hypothetical protein [Arenimonas composti]|uniref:Uncharacterized protein n=1 Tax=Arenimonas composti TR7-09 = DSM 18010 TaxID=1121013 RepID=A0A091BBS1_9GAMM|nr:hypothetical protein [Arenimonas composti]KFN49206.1 hypothetical protein P873_12180 [Arenimonas composti TR7-09 = DSM 18010]